MAAPLSRSALQNYMMVCLDTGPSVDLAALDEGETWSETAVRIASRIVQQKQAGRHGHGCYCVRGIVYSLDAVFFENNCILVIRLCIVVSFSPGKGLLAVKDFV